MFTNCFLIDFPDSIFVKNVKFLKIFVSLSIGLGIDAGLRAFIQVRIVFLMRFSNHATGWNSGETVFKTIERIIGAGI
jgi:hypothetical protein